MMINATSLIPTGDGCSAICPVEDGFILEEGSEVTYKYEADGLLVECSGLAVKIPADLFDYLQEDTLVDDEELGRITQLHLYGSGNGYLGRFILTLPVLADEFIKAKGVAAYLASNPR